MDAGHDVSVAVNLSARCLLDAGLPDLVERLLTGYGVPAELLRLEITENAVMGDADRSMEMLHRLHDLGVRLSIDDFGTGYSLDELPHRLPVDELKVDRSFVHGDARNARRRRPRAQAIDLGHNLGPHRRRRRRRGPRARWTALAAAAATSRRATTSPARWPRRNDRPAGPGRHDPRRPGRAHPLTTAAHGRGPGQLLTWPPSCGERVTRIELALSAWEADVLPLNYTRGRPPEYLAALRAGTTPLISGASPPGIRSPPTATARPSATNP